MMHASLRFHRRANVTETTVQDALPVELGIRMAFSDILGLGRWLTLRFLLDVLGEHCCHLDGARDRNGLRLSCRLQSSRPVMYGTEQALPAHGRGSLALAGAPLGVPRREPHRASQVCVNGPVSTGGLGNAPKRSATARAGHTQGGATHAM